MIEVRGRTASEGVAVGPAFLLSAPVQRDGTSRTRTPDEELRRIDEAVRRAQAELDELRAKSGHAVGENAAEILEVQRLMLEDPDYRVMIDALVREQGLSAEGAVRRTGEHFARTFAETGDECLAARAGDVRDVSNRLLTCLDGQVADAVPAEPSVLVAVEIVPSQLMRIDRKLILALVSSRGSANSHASILARALGIPAVVNASVDFARIRPGQRTLVDGTQGRVVLDPDEQAAAAFRGKTAARTDRRAELVERCAGKVEICVNISGPDDLAGGLPTAFAGVGLFRTEFLYLGRPDLPDEDEQLAVYRKVLDRVGKDRKVVIRTFDLGADKTAEALPCATEANPALGCRGIRLAFAHPGVFKTQLRALFRAAACGDVRIMYPMISSCEEVARIKALVAETAAELEREGVAHRVPAQGVMIETPAAALVSDELARMVDFFSIGTNDLTQYTLALDREGEGLEAYFRPHHPAVLQLIRLTAENGHRAGIPVSICGELAADPDLLETFVGLRIDSLSVSC